MKDEENAIKTDLSLYNNESYRPGAGRVKRAAWFIINVCFFLNPLIPFYGIKVFLLRLFGARVGRGVVIKPSVNIKYPWNLIVGDHVWIGEKAWIDNLAKVSIGGHVCISQGAMLICGNHDFSKRTFDLMTGEICLEDGAWIGAGAMVGPGVKVGSHAVLSLGSAATADLQPYTIYRGNPAEIIKKRTINP